MEVLSSLTELLISGGQAHHIVLEVLLIVWVLWLITKKSSKQEIRLTEKEKEALIKDFEPEPLVTDVPLSHYAFQSRIVHGKAGKYINVDGIECLNFATHNYLGFIGNEGIEQKAIQTINKYGVGSCGPRGFYGTTEMHLELEERLAEFMGTEDAAVYSYAFSAVASAIPAYAKRGDIIFVSILRKLNTDPIHTVPYAWGDERQNWKTAEVMMHLKRAYKKDEKVNFSIQKGLDASRSTMKYFKHNDIEDLHRILEETRMADLKNIKKAQRSRRFLIVEGIYANTGLICPLKELIKLSKKYKLRVFVDESISFGVLGATGRGVTEYFGVPREDVDLIMASLECSVGAIGGFCVGSTFIVDHQRLSGLGYCFSASQPPLLAMAAIYALQKIDQKPKLLSDLSDLCHLTHDRLNGSETLGRNFDISGHRDSPVHLLNLKTFSDSNSSGQAIISEIIEACLQERIAITRASSLDKVDTTKPKPSIRITTTTFHTDDTVSKLVHTLESICLKILPETSERS